MALLLRACEHCVARCVAGSSLRAFSSLPCTQDVPPPTPFWERKIFKRFERMDYNKDGFVDEADLNAHINVITGRNKYPMDAIMQLKELYREAWKRVWSFGVSNTKHRVSRREFVRGYTHIIKDAEARRKLATTLEDLLGGCWDTFDRAYHGSDSTPQGVMSRQEFIDYKTCWNLTDEEAGALFDEIAGRDAVSITKAQYLHAAWDFYFSMNPAQGKGQNFWGTLQQKKSHLSF